MAIIKLAEDKNTGMIRKYQTEEAVYNLVCYTIQKSSYTLFDKLQFWGNNPECVANQILFFQKCRSKDMANRALHLIISFSTGKYEHFIKNSIESIIFYLRLNYFDGYQKFLCLHIDKPSHWHIHYIVNPVNPVDFTMLRYDIKYLRNKMAEDFYLLYGIAVQGVNYFNSHDALKKGEETGLFLYQNYFCKEFGLNANTFDE